MSEHEFVPHDFEPPLSLATPDFVLEPLGPQHNDSDYAAWSSSIAHIHATPGFVGSSWPHEMTLEENLDDLERHARDFANRSGFTYTVLDREGGAVVGCLYIYPRPGGRSGGRNRSLLGQGRPGRARRAALAHGLGMAARRVAVP